MLLKRDTLEAIREGRVDLAFRIWKRPSVKAGGTLHTPIGVLCIRDVCRSSIEAISEAEARRADFGDLAALTRELRGREGALYRIELSYGGADPRIALREQQVADPAEMEALRVRLQRLDARSRGGAWTLPVLDAMERNPGQPARVLAEALGTDRDSLKRNVRKLKNLGLTISLGTGYELSPRGRSLLQQIQQ